MRLITLNKNLYVIRFQYLPSLVEKVKELPDRRWNPELKAWTVPARHQKEVENFASAHRFTLDVPVAEAPVYETDYPEVLLPELTVDIPLKGRLFDFQRSGVAYILQKKKLIVGAQMGLGKAQPLSAKIATPQGWIKMGDVFIGMPVYGQDGKSYKVTGIFPQGERPVYKIAFSDGTSTRCDIDHIWAVRDVNRRKRGTGWIEMTTRQLMKSGVKYNDKKGTNKWQIPLAEPLNIDERNFLIHPYILGALIGDGSLTNRHIAISIPPEKEEIIKRISQLLPDGLKIWYDNSKDCPQHYITQTGTTGINPFYRHIKWLGLDVKSKEKFIPQGYLFSSTEQRIELLRGLMDTDGSASNNRITFHTCSTQLANDISDLVFSLGGQAIISEYDRSDENKSTEYQVNIRLDICPFHLSTKKAGWWIRNRNRPVKYLQSIIEDGVEYQQCISVDSPDGLYLTDSFIVTHNTIQAIAAITAAEAFPCLVICPASLKLNWEREWRTWTKHKALILSDNVKRTFKYFYDSGLAKVFIVNYESLKKYFVAEMPKDTKKLTLRDITFNGNKDFFKSVIIDEAHRVKDPKAQQTKFTRAIADKKEWVLALTGTPVVNKPADLASQLAIIGRLGDFGGWKHFMDRYENPGKPALLELQYKLKSYCFYRRDKSEATDLPPKTRQVVMCDITTRKEYNDALADLADYLKKYRQATDDQVARSMRGEVMVRIGILKNISARGKLEACFEWIRDTLDNGEKLILFGHLREVLGAIKKKFPAVSITGEDSIQERQKSIDRFQNDPGVNLIVCSIAAAGVGITLTASSTVGFIEMGWHPAIMEQAEDRAHRIGQKDHVNCIYFIGRDTIDEWVYKLIDEKRNMSNLVTGAKDDVEESIMDSIIELFNQKYNIN